MSYYARTRPTLGVARLSGMDEPPPFIGQPDGLQPCGFWWYWWVRLRIELRCLLQFILSRRRA